MTSKGTSLLLIRLGRNVIVNNSFEEVYIKNGTVYGINT